MNPAQLGPLALDLMLAIGTLFVLVVDLFLPEDDKRSLGYLSALLLAVIFGASFAVDTSGIALFGKYQGGAWPLFFKRVFLVAGFVAVLGSIEFVAKRHPKRQGEYYLLLLFSLLGMTLLPGARDLILLVVCFELMGLPLYVLAAYAKNDKDPEGRQKAPEAALKLYLVGAASTGASLFGLSMIYGLAGTTDIAALGQVGASPLLSLALALVFGGMGFKIGMVPFHMWVPDTYEGAATPFVAFLSVAPKLAGFSALLTIFVGGFGGHAPTWVPLVLGVSLVSMTLGNILAIPQRNIKRLLGFSGVAQIGYMLLGFATMSESGIAMLIFFAAGYTATNLGAFLVVQAVSASGCNDDISSFDGLARRCPWLALSMLLFLLSLAGIPFVVGFWAKFYLFMEAWRAGLEQGIPAFQWLVVAGVLLAMVGLFYYLQVARAMYMKPAGELGPVPVSPTLGLAIVTCLAFVVGMGLWPRPFVDAALAAAHAFMG